MKQGQRATFCSHMRKRWLVGKDSVQVNLHRRDNTHCLEIDWHWNRLRLQYKQESMDDTFAISRLVLQLWVIHLPNFTSWSCPLHWKLQLQLETGKTVIIAICVSIFPSKHYIQYPVKNADVVASVKAWYRAFKIKCAVDLLDEGKQVDNMYKFDVLTEERALKMIKEEFTCCITLKCWKFKKLGPALDNWIFQWRIPFLKVERNAF